MQFMTTEWAEAYVNLWNNDEILAKKLKNFSATFQYTIKDREDLESIIITVEKGQCTHFETEENFSGKKIEFTVLADSQEWTKVFNHEMSVKDVMKSSGFKFGGPKLKALSNKAGLERSVEILLNMQSVTV